MKSKKRIQHKPHLTISNIGKTRFWTGIFLGICYAFIFYSFVFCFLEIINLFRVALSFDIPLQSIEALAFEHTLSLAISVAMGNHAMVRYWMMQPTFNFHKTRKQIALRVSNYSLFIEFLCWYMLMEYLRHLISSHALIGSLIYEYHGIFLYAIPIYLFLSSWTKLIRYFRAQKWQSIALVISLFCVLSLSFINVSNFRYSEINFEKIYKKDLLYLNNEIALAKKTMELYILIKLL